MAYGIMAYFKPYLKILKTIAEEYANLKPGSAVQSNTAPVEKDKD